MADRKPERRKSSLQGMTPVTTQVVPPATPPAPAPAAVEPQPAAYAVATAAAAKKADRTGRLNYYVDKDEQGRIRAAYYAGRDKHGWRSFSDMQREAVMRLVEQLERDVNGGLPFEGLSAGSISAGRPLE